MPPSVASLPHRWPSEPAIPSDLRPGPQEIVKLAGVIEEEQWLFAKPRHTYEQRR